MALNDDTLNFLRQSPNIKFSKAGKGFDRDQVRKTLDKLPLIADEIERLIQGKEECRVRAEAAEARLVEAQAPAVVEQVGMPAVSQDFDETLRNTLVSAQRTADSTIKQATEEADRLRAEAEFQSTTLLNEAKAEAEQLEADTEVRRQRIEADLEQERAIALEAASDEIRARKLQIDAELAEAYDSERQTLINQIEQLQNTHQLLQADVTRFEEHLDGRRKEVREALSRLTDVLDDPEGLRSKEAIAAGEVPAFSSDNYQPIGLTVESVDSLEVEAAEAMESVEIEGLGDVGALDSVEVVVEDEPTETVESVIESDTEVEFLEGEATEVEAIEEPEIGVFEEVSDMNLATTRSVPPHPTNNSGTGDPYLEELRRVTMEEPVEGDAISSFLEDEPSDKSGGWFGRRK